MGTTQAKATAADAKVAAEREKTPSEIAAEAKELLDSLLAKASGPSEAEIVRHARLDRLSTVIGSAALQIATLCEGTIESGKALAALKSFETAKYRATAAINAIPDAVLLGADEATPAPEPTADDEEAGL